MAFTPEQAREAGKKSKRKPTGHISVKDTRSKAKAFQGAILKDQQKIIRELNQLQGSEYVTAYTRLLPFCLPKLTQMQVATTEQIITAVDLLTDNQVLEVAEAIANIWDKRHPKAIDNGSD